MDEVTFLINSLGENTDDKEVLEQQKQAKKNLNGVYKELQYSLEHLKKCWVGCIYDSILRRNQRWKIYANWSIKNIAIWTH